MAVPGSEPFVAAPVAPGWRPGDPWAAAVRGALLLVLLAGVASAGLSFTPAHRQEADLVADISAGRVTHLEYQSSDRVVRWVDGGLVWYETSLESWNIDPQVDPSAPPSGDQALAWLNRRIDASGHPVYVTFRDNNQRWWPGRVAWGPLRFATGAAWLLTFLMMLSRSRHRYANRWAWFWLFTFGQVGVLLYLLLEPQPLWRPGSWPPRDRRPTGGGMGFLYAIALSIGTGLVGYAVVAALV